MHPMPGPPATLDARHAKPTARRVARSAAPKAQLLANEPCEWQWPDHDHWLAEQARAHAAEVHTAAERFGIRLPPFDALRAALPARAEYEHRTAGAGHECRRLEYLSDGLRVKGYLWKSRNTGARRRPVVVYNRGGCGEYARLTPRTREGFFDFLDAGFVVVGSQYRGNDGGEGRDEIGGADVNDVINLVALLPRIDCADPGHVFVLGVSRGGMMTCMALARGVAARAAATVGCESDLALNAMRRPELFRIYVERVPGFMHHAPGLLRERSARHWPERLRSPLLLLHGGADWRVDAAEAIDFAAALHAARRPFQLSLFAGDDHALSFNWRERDRQTIDWFRRHMDAGAPGNTGTRIA